MLGKGRLEGSFRPWQSIVLQLRSVRSSALLRRSVRHQSQLKQYDADSLHQVRRFNAGPEKSLRAKLALAMTTTSVAGFSLYGTDSQRISCESSADDDDDDEFSYSFAKPPVPQAPPDHKFEVHVSPGAGGLSRPVAEVALSSTFSLPVERGWPRDTLSQQDVAESMLDVLLDRLPRWSANYVGWELTGMPLARRSQDTLAHWPRSTAEAPVVCSPSWWPSQILPPAVKLWLLEEENGHKGFIVGGWLLGGDGASSASAPSSTQSTEAASGEETKRKTAVLYVEVVPVGTTMVHDDADESGFAERLDLRLTTRLVNAPVAGKMWSLVGCGGRWWFERVRLPRLKQLFTDFHILIGGEMMVYYVAALAGSA